MVTIPEKIGVWENVKNDLATALRRTEDDGFKNAQLVGFAFIASAAHIAATGEVIIIQFTHDTGRCLYAMRPDGGMSLWAS